MRKKTVTKSIQVLVLTVLLGLASTTIQAQPILNSNDELLNEARFMLGISGMNFSFQDNSLSHVNGEQAFRYQLNSDVYTAFIGSGKFSGLSLSFGTGTEQIFSSELAEQLLSEDQNNDSDVRFLNVRATLGGNSQVWESILRQDLNLYIPIRVNLNYFNVYYDIDSDVRQIFEENFRDSFRPLNKLESSFNIGLGVNYRTDRFFPFFRDRLMVDLHFTRGLGANVQYTDGEMFYGGARHDEINASVHLLRILGQTSFVTGFRHIQTRTNQDGFDDFFAMLTDPDVFESSHSSLMFFVGIKF